MITLFEKFISRFENPDLGDIIADLNIDGDRIRVIQIQLQDRIRVIQIQLQDQYVRIVDKIADWYYDNYNISFLGSGAYGTAFRINNEENRVLKITTDENEAANVSYLVKKSGVKGIVDYYDIHQVDVFEDGEKLITVYSIIMEKLYKISDMESGTFMLLFQKYFKPYENEIVNLYDGFSRKDIGCTFREFKKLNPNNVNKFIDEHSHDYYIERYNIDEVKELANVYYKDIMDMVESVIKYDLILGDVHTDNIRKTEDGHMKVIDPGGYSVEHKNYRSKSAPIKIDITEDE